MVTNQIYHESFVVFLDLLGFTDAVYERRDDAEGTKLIVETLKKIQNNIDFIQGGAKEKWKKDIRLKAVSDSIVITCSDISAESFVLLANTIAAIQVLTIPHLFFFRGAMTVGPVYEEGSILFGPAYINVLNLEKLSNWPRVVVDTSVLDKLPGFDIRTARKAYLNQDESGLYYLNYLHLVSGLDILRVWDEVEKDRDAKIDYIGRFYEHKKYIETAVKMVIEKGKITLLPKYHALANYHNEYMKALLTDLPSDPDYKKIGTDNAVGDLIGNLRTFTSSRERITADDIESIVKALVEGLVKDRESIMGCLIDLSAIYPKSS
jgi:hypothetical protein